MDKELMQSVCMTTELKALVLIFYMLVHCVSVCTVSQLCSVLLVYSDNCNQLLF